MTPCAHRIDVRSVGRVRVITLDRAAKPARFPGFS